LKSQKKFIITAGPTREFIDPFRFISNPSSGKMGYALARAALERGHDVILISGPVSLPPVPGVRLVPVTSAREMRAAVMEHAPAADAVVMAAAVSDYRPARFSPAKLKKAGERISLPLVRNPDIIGELGGRKGGAFLTGFSADTENIIDNAREKLKSKGLDLIIANDISAPGSGFGAETNRATVIHRDGKVEEWPLLGKDALAGRIVDLIAAKMGQGG